MKFGVKFKNNATETVNESYFGQKFFGGTRGFFTG